MDETTWFIGKSGFPTNTEFIEIPEKAMDEPYPDAMWRIKDDSNNKSPFNEVLLNVDLLGVFANAKDLQEVSIPRSVKKIGRYSFANTQLKSVTIAKNCEYYDTSFPKGCKINFYP